MENGIAQPRKMASETLVLALTSHIRKRSVHQRMHGLSADAFPIVDQDVFHEAESQNSHGLVCTDMLKSRFRAQSVPRYRERQTSGDFPDRRKIPRNIKASPVSSLLGLHVNHIRKCVRKMTKRSEDRSRLPFPEDA